MSAPAPGELALVLHTHLPYLRGHGTWPVGEEWLFQAWGESWLPVTDLLLRLGEDGARDVLTLGITPLVAHQVADQRLRRDMGTWLATQMWRSEEQRALHGALGPEVVELGSFYWRHYARLLDLHERIERGGGLLPTWADLADRGVIELLGGPATHPYLPLQRHQRLIEAQLTCGLDHHASWAGTRPTGVWAPEMGYRPAGQVSDPTAVPLRIDRDGTPTLPRAGPELPGLESHYAQQGVTHFLVDAPTLVRAAGGRERDWTVRPDVPEPTTDDPYEVVHDGVLVGSSDVVAFARDLSVAYHVWSPSAGYPGNPWYRDFFARGSYGLHPSWRVTDKELGPTEKAPYEPHRASVEVARDADHLHGILREVLDDRPGEIVVAAYDTELFGHWWFEGVAWLEAILRRVRDDRHLRTTTLRSRLERRAPRRRLDLPESSWGYAKGHASWVTEATRPMWTSLRAAEQRVLGLPALADAEPEVQQQVARELALASSSDWPFMVNRGNSPDYARERFEGHIGRVHALCDAAESGGGTTLARELARLDDAPANADLLASALLPEPDHNSDRGALVVPDGGDERAP